MNNNTSQPAGSGTSLDDILTGLQQGVQAINNLSLSISAIVSSSTTNDTITASLGSDVLLNNVANYFDGPAITLTTGTWLVTGQITVTDGGAASIYAKLWDGTNVIASGTTNIPGGPKTEMMTLTGAITCVGGTIVKISARDISTVNGKILFNDSGNSKDSTITASLIR